MTIFLIMLLTIILIAIAAACNAVCDRLENQVAFNASVFSKRNPYFWCKELSWDKVKRIFGYKLDAWHLFKSGWVCSLLLAIFINHYVPRDFNLFTWWHWIAYAHMGLIWNGVFTLFYHHLLKRK